ncbi:hypothetical protein, partial [Candidimonas sp. SYP-B2681]|uniref:hypothetical protein n=1 Tax=Candidimonas sp. SYP-B2681 TaxID=2497686 RepID=UPI001F1D8081
MATISRSYGHEVRCYAASVSANLTKYLLPRSKLSCQRFQIPIAPPIRASMQFHVLEPSCLGLGKRFFRPPHYRAIAGRQGRAVRAAGWLTVWETVSAASSRTPRNGPVMRAALA